MKILIIRTDRIGDVVLSTPAIEAVRRRYPEASISVMVQPCAREIIEGREDVDEVILYDKKGGHRSWIATMRFALELRRKHFDIAFVLHPANRAHIIVFFAGIRKRVGFNRKMAWLLTDRIEHRKQEGMMHEAEYTLEVVESGLVEISDLAGGGGSCLGTAPKMSLLRSGRSCLAECASLRAFSGRPVPSHPPDEPDYSLKLTMPVREEDRVEVTRMLETEGIKEGERFVAIHPSASCPSKRWPVERFAEVVDYLIKSYGYKVVLVGSEEARKDCDRVKVLAKNRSEVISFCSRTTVGQLAELLKRSVLFISNDSGPVHISTAVGTPVISIFGRNQAGLSPVRWRPLGEKDVYLHREVGCRECPAHNCRLDFKCLKAISFEDVTEEVRKVLG